MNKRGASVGMFYLYTMIVITILLILASSCTKQDGRYYKYCYIDSRKVDVVTTHIITSDHTMSDEEINTRLSSYRAMPYNHVVRDTILPLEEDSHFLIKK